MADKDFTPREYEIMAKAWNCLTEEPKVDYKKLAAECGMGNPRSASNAWATIKKKVMAKGGNAATSNGGENGEGEANGDGTPKPTPKATPRKRGKGKAEKVDGGSPTKKAKGRKGKLAEVEEDGEGEVSPVKGEPEDDDGTFI